MAGVLPLPAAMAVHGKETAPAETRRQRWPAQK